MDVETRLDVPVVIKHKDVCTDAGIFFISSLCRPIFLPKRIESGLPSFQRTLAMMEAMLILRPQDGMPLHISRRQPNKSANSSG